MSAKHTPGQWRVNWGRDTSYPLGVHNGKVNVVTAFGRCASPEATANARLIAAAPDLLAALKRLDASWTEFWPKGPDVPESRERVMAIEPETAEIWREIRSAIAAAEGTTP